MPDQPLPLVPEAKTVPKRRLHVSIVWTLPIVAAVAGIWIGATTILSKGPEITIVFSSADGIEVNKTRVDYNGLNIGTITHLRLADDRKHVIATAQMSSTAKSLLVKDTRFWVVKPRVSGLNISGLGTLISGYYVSLQVGQSAQSERKFTALDSPPLMGDVPGRYFTLKSPKLGSLSEGTPVFFRQLQAGQVVSYQLDKDGKFLDVRVFVQSPYDQFVTPDTRFWNASGIDISLSTSGLQVQTESLLSILAGGIAFEAPGADSPMPPAAADTVFTLFNNRADAFDLPVQDPHVYLLVFKQSVRGLTVGSPVQLGGITIGEVTQISPQFDEVNSEFTVPVTVCVDPERYGVKFINMPAGEDAMATHKRDMDTLVARGMRARLQSGNLLTGSMYVSVEFFTNEPPVALDWSQKPVQLPTISGSTEALEDSINGLLKNLNQTIVTAGGTLTNADKLLGNANQLIEPNSALEAALNDLLLQGGDAARAVRVLADYLERHPEALIRGKTKETK